MLCRPCSDVTLVRGLGWGLHPREGWRHRSPEGWLWKRPCQREVGIKLGSLRILTCSLLSAWPLNKPPIHSEPLVTGVSSGA